MNNNKNPYVVVLPSGVSYNEDGSVAVKAEKIASNRIIPQAERKITIKKGSPNLLREIELFLQFLNEDV